MVRNQIRSQSGFTIIESLFGMIILTILILALFTIISTNLANLFNSKARSIGLNLAQEKIENLKNLPYDSLATVSGPIYPAGNILDDESIIRDNLRFRVHTDIRYVDNNYDGNSLGTGGKPADLYPYDYKKITVQVFAGSSLVNQLVELSSDVAAKAAETSSNTGVLIIRVINAAGNPVEDATVQVTNVNPNPDVSITSQTDSQGQLIIPKLPPDATNGYHVVITKGGYSSDQTIPIGGGFPAPTNPDFGLIAQQTTIKSFAIDNLSNLTLTIKNPAGTPLSNLPVTIQGAKTTNTTPVIYKTQQTINTNASGVAQFNLIEWDSYDISIAGYTILSTSPFRPITAAPAGIISASVTAAINPNSYPIISDITPTTSAAVAGVIIDITGSNMNSGSSFVLRQAGQADRAASGIVYTAPDSLTGTVNLAGAASGNWNLVLSTGGNTTIQENAIGVTP